MITKNVDILIVGGGPAGLAAALGAFESGTKDIVVIEREKQLGGILNQCIHNGFGLHTFNEELTGPEYALKYEVLVKEKKIPYLLETTVLNISEDKKVITVNKEQGLVCYNAKAIILACGCRERPRGAINIAGSRPAGVFSAGTAQKLVNIDGFSVGKEVVVLGSGDIGLIMARRMVFEGAKVKAVVELMPYSSGLNRNIVQCLNDFDIPLKFSHTIIEIKGKERITSVVIAKVDEFLAPILSTAEEIFCDTLLLSVGLLPENELASGANVTLSKITGGAVVNDYLMTDVDGVFACGNVLHVHDLVDFVSEESKLAGSSASRYVEGKLKAGSSAKVTTGNGVRYVVPSSIENIEEEKEVSVKFRVNNVYKKVTIIVSCQGEVIKTKKAAVVAPGEMETLKLNTKTIKGDVVVSLEVAK